MTYCLAWKKDKRVYLIADSALSSKKDFIQKDITTFGEVSGLYGQDYIQDIKLKIYSINSKLAVTFEGDVDIFEEIVEYIYQMINSTSIKDIFRDIEGTYGGQDLNIQLIFVLYDTKNRIFLFDGNHIIEKDDFAEIGSGKDITGLSHNIKSFINYIYPFTLDKNEYLAAIIAYTQLYMLKNDTFRYGVGGVIYGIYLDTKIHWFRDLEYYLYDDGVEIGDTVSVISRYSSVFSSSGVTRGSRFFLNTYTDSDLYYDIYYRRGIIRSLDNINSFYYVFYSNKYNTIHFVNTNGESQNSCFRKWTKRDINKTEYAYLFDRFFAIHLENNIGDDIMKPDFSITHAKLANYLPHDEVKKQLVQEGRNEHRKFDYDFQRLKYKKQIQKLVHSIRENIKKYYNLVLIDYTFFCNAVEEKISLYKFSNIDISKLSLEMLRDGFMQQLVETTFDKYKFVVIKDLDDNREIDGMCMTTWFKQYDNCTIIDTKNAEKELLNASISILKEYYLNDDFFHLDKLVLILDDSEIDKMLALCVPEINYKNDNPDIILVRNINGYTKMFCGLRHIDIDYLIPIMLGLTMNQIGFLESGIPIDLES